MFRHAMKMQIHNEWLSAAHSLLPPLPNDHSAFHLCLSGSAPFSQVPEQLEF